MKKFALLVLVLALIAACGYPKETRRGVGNEGLLIIQAVPADAEVFVDGQKMGRAEKFESDPLELSSGTHKIELRREGFLPDIRDIYVGNQSRHTLKVNMRKSP